MTSAQNTPLGLHITPAQGVELARLIELHRPESVALPQRRVGFELVVTLLCATDDLRFVIDIGGASWRADRNARSAA